VTVLVWLVLITGIATLVRVTVDVVQGDSSGFLLFWPLLITVAAGSRSLVAAIVQNKLVPKFVDLALPGFNVDVQKLQGALS